MHALPAGSEPSLSAEAQPDALAQTPLFRAEAMAVRRAPWLGELLLAPQLSHRVYTTVAMVAAAAIRQLTTQKLRLLYRIGNSLIIGALAILVVWLGAHRVFDGAMTVGVLLAFIACKDKFLSRISHLIDRAVDLTTLRLHAGRLADIALAAPEARAQNASDAVRRGSRQCRSSCVTCAFVTTTTNPGSSTA